VTTASHRLAAAELAARDPVLADLVATHGPVRLRPRPRVEERFRALARAIAYQQLAGKAAASIWGRVQSLADGSFDPDTILALPNDALRGAGLSQAKTDAIRDLARLVATDVIRLDRVGRMADDDVVAMLTQAKGVGPWTAHMFLLFDLHRLDVWPTGDYGVRVGYGRAYGLPEPPTTKDLEALGERYRPYRSVVAWYCWRAADTVVPSA
jgi:3-methyladenine DNA glycosylase/8-oxoguanine DNA glycosylase